MGLKLYVPHEYRLNSVIAIEVPTTVDIPKMLQHMISHFHVEISAAFGLSIVRIGQMGEQCRHHNLHKVLYATGMSFLGNGVSVDVANGMSRLEERLAFSRMGKR